MFEKRLRAFLILLGCALVVLLTRLGQLQIVQGDYYRRRAEEAVVLAPTQLPFVRGSIRDRAGEVLVSDEPAWDLTIDFGAIAAEFDPTGVSLDREARRWKRARRYPDATTDEEVEKALADELRDLWNDLERFAASTGSLSTQTVHGRARENYEHVLQIRAGVAGRRGFDAPVAEESDAHAVLTELGAAQQIAARERLGRYPWVHVDASSVRRFAPNSEAFAHVLGRVGPVDREAVENDPNAGDPFAEYHGRETLGISGAEWAVEQTLRGRRGQIVRDRDGKVIEDISAENGRDALLTIHAPLQRRLYDLLGETVGKHSDSNGGAIVVLDVATREVLALVSYPSYDPNRFSALYPRLRDDTDRLPLLFRAVTTRYSPGSTIKPLVCLAGLFNGVVTTDTREECRGYLLPDHPDRWRCWEIHGTETRMAHGLINVEQALTGSCNVFMYRLGEMLGVDRLCGAFDMVGIGRKSGLGLREDEEGINPTPSWLMRNKNLSVTPGTARLFAIGQGELSMTPVQVANLMATYANGRYRPVTLVRGAEPSPEWTLPGTPEQWSVIRRGIYGVVNDPEGTAYKYAHFVNERYALCGKTGSATAHPWPTAYRIPYLDEYRNEHVAIVREGSKGPAIERFRKENPLAIFDPNKVEVETRWPPNPPPEGGNHAHAWFAGFLQPIDAAGRPDWSKTPRVAFAALVEFGGSGGRTSGPLAKDVSAVLLDVLGPDLDVPPPLAKGGLGGVIHPATEGKAP